jgi:hypothetical protein
VREGDPPVDKPVQNHLPNCEISIKQNDFNDLMDEISSQICDQLAAPHRRQECA